MRIFILFTALLFVLQSNAQDKISGRYDRATKRFIPADKKYYITKFYWGGLAVVNYKGKEGIIDTTGKLVKPIQYDIVKFPINKFKGPVYNSWWGHVCYIITYKDNKVGLLDTLGNTLLEPEYDGLGPSRNGYIVWAKKIDDKHYRRGIIDNKGNIQLPADYWEIGNLGPNVYKVTMLSQKPEYVNEKGQPISLDNCLNFGWETMPIYIHIKNFNSFFKDDKPVIKDFPTYIKQAYLGDNRYYVFKTHNGKQGVVNRYGKVILKPISTGNIWGLHDTLNNTLTFEHDRKYGIFDTSGNIIYNEKLSYSKTVFNTYIVSTDDRLYGLVDSSLKEIIKPQYSNMQAFYNKHYIVKLKGQEAYRFINADGSFVNDNIYDKVYYDNKTFAFRRGNVMGTFDKNCNEVITIPDNTDLKDGLSEYWAKYKDKSLFGFDRKYHITYKNKKFGIVDSVGNVFIPLIFDNIDVLINQRLIDAYKYKSIRENALFEKVSKLNDNYIYVLKDKKFGVVDTAGKIVVPIEYNQINYAYNDRFIVTNSKDLKGVVDTTGKQILPFAYGKIVYMKEDKYLACLPKGSLIGIVNEAGKQVLPFKYVNIFYNDSVLFVSYKGEPKVTSRVINEAGMRMAEYYTENYCFLINKNWQLGSAEFLYSSGSGSGYLITPDNVMRNNFDLGDIINGQHFLNNNCYSTLALSQNMYNCYNPDLKKFNYKNFKGIEYCTFTSPDNSIFRMDRTGKKITPKIDGERIWFTTRKDGPYGVFSVKEDLSTYFGVINPKGEIIIPADYRWVKLSDSTDYIIAEGRNFHEGVIDYNNKLIVPYKYYINTAIRKYGVLSHLHITTNPSQDYYGFYDFEGNQVVPDEYDEIEFLDNDEVLHLKKGRASLYYNAKEKRYY